MDYRSISVHAKKIHFPSFFGIVAAAAAAAPGHELPLLLLDLFISKKPIQQENTSSVGVSWSLFVRLV